MNYIDILIGFVVLLCIWGGWQRGFIVSSLNLALLVAGMLISFWGYRYLANLFERFLPLGVWNLPVSFLLTFLLATFVLGLITNRIVNSVSERTHGHPANRALGMIPGFVRGLLYALLISALLLSFPISNSISRQTRESFLASRMAMGAEWLEDKLSPVFDDAIKQTINRLTVDPNSESTVSLPYTTKDARIREDLEARMLEMVNEERLKHGLRPVIADPEMQVVARAHSRDMFGRGYFSHYTPEGKDPFDRMRSKKVKFTTAGENLALAQTLTLAHNGLMNSPGHRANILNPSYGRLGIGILDGGIYGLMVTQNFRN
jgi:uncharacterized protein YkwD